MVFHLHGACNVQGWPWVSHGFTKRPSPDASHRFMVAKYQLATLQKSSKEVRDSLFSGGCCTTLVHHMALSCFVWVRQMLWSSMVYYNLIILPSYHIILSSYHLIIVSCYHIIILSSYHLIISSYHHNHHHHHHHHHHHYHQQQQHHQHHHHHHHNDNNTNQYIIYIITHIYIYDDGKNIIIGIIIII